MPTAVTTVVKESTTPTKQFWTWIVLTRRKEGISHEDFARHYHEIHSKLARRVPGLILYRQNLLCQTPGPESSVDSEFDACSEYTYVSEEAYGEAKGTEEWKALDRDSKEFMGFCLIGLHRVWDASHINEFDTDLALDTFRAPSVAYVIERDGGSDSDGAKAAKCEGGNPCPRCKRLSLVCSYKDDGRRRSFKILKGEVLRLRSILENHGIPYALAAADNPEGLNDIMATNSEEAGMGSRKGTPSVSTNPGSSSQGLFRDSQSGQLVHYGSSSFHSILAESGQDQAILPCTSTGLPITGQDPHIINFSNISPELHGELLDLWFRYNNGYSVYIDQHAFREGCATGIPSHSYSRLLHLSILAEASHISSHPGLRSNPDDPSTSGIGFLMEAMSLLQMEMEPRQTTAVALCLLCASLSDSGQEFLSWIFGGNSWRISQHLGLHLDGRTNEEEVKHRRQAMWGVFFHDKLMTLYTGRGCGMQFEDLALPLPTYPSPAGSTVWDAGPVYLDECTNAAFARLGVVAGHIMRDIYGVRAQHHRMSRTVIEAFGNDLLNWAKTLPPPLQDAPEGIRSQSPRVLRVLHLIIIWFC
ncbi:hypothetical protein I305_05834 [Cryptococcus gattii E566]|uniref:Xylanolytic transcriptional activator regulatory domain-containing protein n=1 Tax=Cryptococcus gattii EJB2 TaxID=1296103 RepID=A0ABR5C166_9TREE|nr:hypothetical protein I306_01262 [Cryptococcus gattii EJB2]KIY31869.1 hypothetical protein I305_05834 [Cryptococcus gattii E566]KJE00240.1 hypothetical protein I311_06144 [Cryptococcus gattii NT-10]